MEDGKVVETGTHDELLANPMGLYTKLVKMQLEMNKVRSEYLGEVSEEEEEAKA